jgi:V/A-type H+-transporting ATPase subunit A
MQGQIIKIAGPLVVADKMRNVKMFDVVHVGEQKLIGEIIELRGDKASIQVYEETAGLRVGDGVNTTGMALSMEMGPGIMGGVYDGIGRPLESIHAMHGDRIARGITLPTIDRKKKWEFKATRALGDHVSTGDIIGVVMENEVIEHRIMVPQGINGTVAKIESGSFTVTEAVAQIKGDVSGTYGVTMLTVWPVRLPRPYKRKLVPSTPLITGQRIIDTLFPVAKGGVAAIPGPFGSGKTVVQHQIAKWADADIVVYIGCGERGNEICDVLHEFPQLVDRRNNQPMIKRTILIANTSDMPVAAREASIYTGITIAEYFRDMGYNVAIMADSTSRWAEALREMSGRMEELPGEEGYPAYLTSRIAQFYERAGIVEVLGGGQGSITAIGAVSPPGGDLAEPIVQATMRIVKTFWALSYSLAHRRHFPAIDWLTSYSLYADKMESYYTKQVHPQWVATRAKALKILQHEAELQEIVRLMGADSLSDEDKKTLRIAKEIREDFLHQNAFDLVDTYTPLKTQFEKLKGIIGTI